jgi:hypothetical protein
MSTWKKVSEGIWVRVYSFHDNPMLSSAIALAGGGLLVLSPGTDLRDADFAELDALGTVKALVAPGAFHNMGLPAWSARYPSAGLYGPTAAAKHIAKVHPGLAPLQDLKALSAILSPDVEVFEVDGCGQPDALVVVRRADGTTWFTNEIITNWPSWPSKLVFRLLFKLTGAGLGLDVSKMALMFIKGKKPAVKAFFEGKLASHPPTQLVPCHGEVLQDPALPQRLGEVLARRLG